MSIFHSKFWYIINVTSVMALSIFNALYGMQTRSCDENSVRPSVRQMREL